MLSLSHTHHIHHMYMMEEAAPVMAPLAEEETVIVGLVSLVEAGSEHSVALFNSEHVS